MYLSNLRIQNWRTYGDVNFDFAEPTSRKSVVLIGAMNGHGKTSFLMALYLGLFGRYGLRYCEGFGKHDEDEFRSYRDALERYRRDNAPPDEPTIIDITIKPTLSDSDEEEVRVVRRWYFTAANKARQGEFEEVDVYVDGRPQRKPEMEKDPLQVAHDRVERNLFPAHVAPAFFFDGEQAQKLIENMGEAGLKKAVEVMFGTKVISEVAETVQAYLTGMRQGLGGKKKASERQQELEKKISERENLNDRIGKLQAEHVRAEREKDEKEKQRSSLQIELAERGGGLAADAAKLQGDYVRAETELAESEKTLAEAVRSLGLALALSRLAPAIMQRLLAEQAREAWEGLMRGTLENKEKVLSFALPEPADRDPLLGALSPTTRHQVRLRFSEALERIYNPPPIGCAPEFLFAHIKGEARSRAVLQLGNVQSGIGARSKAAAKRVRDARERFEEAKVRMERMRNLPEQTRAIKEQLDALNTANQDLSRKLGQHEGEIKKFKADLHVLNEDIGRIQEELARLGPEQQRIAIAERIARAIEALQERLRPTTTNRLEAYVTKYFLKIADDRFRGGKILLPSGSTPEFQWPSGERRALETISGFEKRSFGIGFSLALAEIIRRRIPLVIDTPLGNADSNYRPRTLRTLTDFDLDQVIILTHDQEVTPDLVESLKPSLLQTFLVEYQGRERGSVVHSGKYFTR